MSLTPLVFTGISSYSQDFQAIMERAVNIATVPLKSMQNEQTDVLQKKMLAASLGGVMETLASRLKSLGQKGETGGLTASSSDNTKVVATNVGLKDVATYTLTDITSLAKAAAETSLAFYADAAATPVAVSTPDKLRLVVGSNSKTLDLSGGKNTLVGIRDAINAAGMGVTASILTAEAGKNYLSITANGTGSNQIRLLDNVTQDTQQPEEVDLMTALNPGSNAEFKLNGVPISKKANFINDVAPGLTFDLLGTASSVTVTLKASRSSLRSDLDAFVRDYNAVVDEVGTQIGENAGLLSGDFLVREIQTQLRSVAGYRGESGAVKSMTELGVEFGRDGKAYINDTTFGALTDGQVSGAYAFFGSTTTGFGALHSKVNSVSDPVMGLVKKQQEQYDATDRRLTESIEDLVDKINRMQEGMAARLYAADALLGQLESQQRIVEASVDALKLTMFGKNEE
ncbi:MAG: flagellar filament capping protein FliD [Bryobacteraceae bacterium]|nr:flagellar filament capping protein FliD [Bryobacteraceae bacterium]